MQHSTYRDTRAYEGGKALLRAPDSAVEESDGARRARLARIVEVFRRLDPSPTTALHYQTPFQLLIATILSAQCTDARVNLITARLFSRYPTPWDFLHVSQEELEELIRECGLFRAKARHILQTSRILCERYGGQVPGTLAELTSLPGVGRKTANVVLAHAFQVPALPVDTHVHRVANRLGLVRTRTPAATERELCQLVPEDTWITFHHWLIRHGRRVCRAQGPRCPQCPLLSWCPYGQARVAEEGRGDKAGRGSQPPAPPPSSAAQAGRPG